MKGKITKRLADLAKSREPVELRAWEIIEEIADDEIESTRARS
jgi:hypothetical protein